MTDIWSTACPDWERRLLEGRSLIPDLPLFKEESERALRVFKRLKLPDVIGTPTMEEACGEWFFPFVAAVFGSYDPRINRRMISEFFELIPKGNFKSSGGGAIMLTGMIVNRRPRAEFLIIAPTKEVADISFRQAEDTVAIDPSLKALFHAQRHIRTLTHIRSGAALKIKAADTDVITGSKATYTLVDEVHELSLKPKAAEIMIEIRGALAKRPDGFLIQTTTQSKKPPAGIFKSELARARDVRDGKIRLPVLPLLYELPRDLQKSGAWRERKYWALLNPNLNRSVDETFLADQLRAKEAEGLDKLALFASQHFNVEIGIALRDDRWPGAEHWQKATDATLTLEEILRRCEVCVVGLDGGGLDDLFGLNVVGRESKEIEIEVASGIPGDTARVKKKIKRWLSWSHAWCDKDVLERRKAIASTLEGFAAKGELTITDTPGDDVVEIVETVSKVKDEDLLYCVAADPAGLGEIVDALAEIEVTAENAENERDFLIGAPQGFAMMNALKSGERKLKNGTLLHADQALMDWAIANLKIEPTATAIRATKQNAGDAKIDPAMAMFNAITVMTRNPQSPRSVYEERGLLIA